MGEWKNIFGSARPSASSAESAPAEAKAASSAAKRGSQRVSQQQKDGMLLQESFQEASRRRQAWAGREADRVFTGLMKAAIPLGRYAVRADVLQFVMRYATLGSAPKRRRAKPAAVVARVESSTAVFTLWTGEHDDVISVDSAKYAISVDSCSVARISTQYSTNAALMRHRLNGSGLCSIGRVVCATRIWKVYRVQRPLRISARSCIHVLRCTLSLACCRPASH